MASMYSISNSVIEYFYLKSTNDGLASENIILKNQIVELHNQIDAMNQSKNSGSIKISPEKEISFIYAKVINNSTNKLLNYITLNKGKRDGIYPDMGVINEDGVVGVISNVSEKFSVVMPVINPKIQINSKFAHNNYSGPIQWDGNDYRYAKLNDIARHVDFTDGDSVVTSGYSKSFPEGLLIGIVEKHSISESDAYFNIKVKLSVNFRTLTQVKVIDYKNFSEQQNLENSIQ
ncbi:rod shape-determining protein MreC [Paludibacter sp.]